MANGAMHDKEQFARMLEDVSAQIGFKISARGWAYQLEGLGLITKGEFDRVEDLINRCRAQGYLPIDFVAEEEARQFSGVEVPTELTPTGWLVEYLKAALCCEEWYTPDWWDGEDYYIQLIVEKIDLKTLFSPVCEEYHIPIATSRGWSSMLQRAQYAKRFKDAAELNGLQCVLLYCGDHDPDGLRISDFLRRNLEDLADIVWSDGAQGYYPDKLEINRFGLNYDFIEANHLTWIDNLITASKKDLSSPSHPNHYLPYVQEYLQRFGIRKCEANALVVRPDEARDLMRDTIEGYLGTEALGRFTSKREEISSKLETLRQESGLATTLNNAITLIEDNE